MIGLSIILLMLGTVATLNAGASSITHPDDGRRYAIRCAVGTLCLGSAIGLAFIAGAGA